MQFQHTFQSTNTHFNPHTDTHTHTHTHTHISTRFQRTPFNYSFRTHISSTQFQQKKTQGLYKLYIGIISSSLAASLFLTLLISYLLKSKKSTCFAIFMDVLNFFWQIVLLGIAFSDTGHVAQHTGTIIFSCVKMLATVRYLFICISYINFRKKEENVLRNKGGCGV